MKEEMRLEDVPELMQHIQSLLPETTAACTSVLSKSWLNAWSTIPVLRFHVPCFRVARKQTHLMMACIDRTLIRYLRDNIPIERFELDIQITSVESASLVENWIRSVSTTTCLKELSLGIHFRDVSLNLPDELLSGENITKLKVIATFVSTNAVWMTTSHNHPPVINCVSLRELHLMGVRISQQVLDHILSSCKLLVNINLTPNTVDLNTIKVKSLPCLEELRIMINCGYFSGVEMDHLPNLRLLHCNLQDGGWQFVQQLPGNAHSISLGSRLTELSLAGKGLLTDNTSLNMFKSGFPFLEILTLDMQSWTLEGFRFTCVSPIKRLSLKACPRKLIDIQVNAPNLLFFSFTTYTMPKLSFPISTTLEEINLRFSVTLTPTRPVGVSWFLMMREILELSRKCDLNISTFLVPDFDHVPPLDMYFDLDDLKTRLQLPPATNVETLTFKTSKDECLWGNSQFFDAFFEICHPKHVCAKPDIFFSRNNHFCKMMLKEILQKKNEQTTTTTPPTTTTTTHWSHYLKGVQISRHQKWETLLNSHKSLLDGSTPTNDTTFKLEWY